MDTARRRIFARVRPRVPDVDRKRAARACWRCRDHKSRCVLPRGGSAACMRCQKAGVECTYADEPVFYERRDSVPRKDHQQPRPPVSPAPRHSVTSLGEPSYSLGSPTSVRSNEAARLVVRSARQTRYVGEVSNTNFLSKIQDAVVVDSRVDIGDDEPTELENATDLTLLRKALEGFPPANVAEFLVASFFRHSEANYYFMDRDRFKERLAQLYEDGLEAQAESDPSMIALALMVFAMGSQFAHLQAPTTQEQKPPVSVYKQGPGMVFYMKAKLLLPDLITQSTLESIQVCFLMALFLLPSNSSDLSYVYHGMAVNMAIASGLHRRTSDGGLDSVVIEVRNRLWWSLYVSERRLSIILDRPETIKEEDIDTPFPEMCDTLDRPGGDNNLGNLRASIHLMAIFNRALKLGKALSFADPAAEASVTGLNHDLQRWVTDLPPQLQSSNLDPETKIFRGAVHLHMSYNQIIIFVGRPSLLRLIQTHLHQVRSAASQPTVNAAPHDPADESLARSCVNAAYRMADFVRYLAASRRLASYSYTDLNYSISAAIIIIIHEIIHSHPCYHSTIASILKSMEFLASGGRNAKHGLKLIQNLQVLIAAIKNEWPSTPVAVVSNPDVPVYQQWETWMAQAEQRTTGLGPQHTYGTNENIQHINRRPIAGGSPGTPHYAASKFYAIPNRQASRSDIPSAMDSLAVAAEAVAPNTRSIASGDTSQHQAWENNVGYSSIVSWFDDFNMLGLGDFQSMVFPDTQRGEML